MAKQITINYDGSEYVLAYTRRSVEMLESQGFSIDKVDSQTTTTLGMLYSGAFLARHRNLDKRVIEDILNNIPDRDQLFQKLAEMYNEVIASMVYGDDTPKNATWRADW